MQPIKRISSPQDISPAGIRAALDCSVIGQEEAKRALSSAAYAHLLRQVAPFPEELPRPVVLLVGPTGSGKTHLIRCLGRALGLPMVSETAAHFSKVGYVGMNTGDIAEHVVNAAGESRRRAAAAIIHLDEIDKIATSDVDWGLDVSGKGVQEELLTLIEGTVCRSTRSNQTFEHDTTTNLFLLSGAFVGLLDVARSRRSGPSPSGFSYHDKTEVRDILHPAVSRDDLIAYGFIPEFVNRITTVVTLQPLSAEELLSILNDSSSSPLRKAQTFFEIHGVKLTVREAAAEIIATRAHREGGARLLTTVVEEILRGAMLDLPSMASRGVREVRLDADLVVRETSRKRLRGRGRTELDSLLEQALGLIQERHPGALGAHVSGVDRSASTGITRGADKMSIAEIREILERTKRDLDWENTTGSPRTWWQAFEDENDHRLGKVLRLAEELRNRSATITEFFLAYVYSNTDNIQANLHYLDYVRLKKEEERKKREAAEKERHAKEAEAKKRRARARNSRSKGESGELTFVRCRSCRALVPARSLQCRMCGAELSGEEETGGCDA